MRHAVLASALATIGCNTEEQPAAWLPWDTIEGPLRPEVGQPASPAAPQNRLRIVTYNTLEGFDADPLARALLADPDLASADLWLLQEADRRSGAPADAAQLAAVLDMGYVYAPLRELARGTRGLAILSRFAVRDVAVMYLEDAVSIGFSETSRGAVALVIDTPTAALRVVDVHLDVPLNIGERIVQLRPAVYEAPTPIVVGGDFNTNDYVWSEPFVPLLPLDAVADTAQAPILDEYMRAIGYQTPTSELGATWHGFPEDQRLDSVFVSGVATGAAAVERSIDKSDHWPVWVDIELGP